MQFKGQSKWKERGASLIEYTLLVALISLIAIGTVSSFGIKVKEEVGTITRDFNYHTTGCSGIYVAGVCIGG